MIYRFFKIQYTHQEHATRGANNTHGVNMSGSTGVVNVKGILSLEPSYTIKSVEVPTWTRLDKNVGTDDVNSSNNSTFDNSWHRTTKNLTRLSLSKCNVNQELINNLSKYLQEKECLVNELVLDGINLKNINYVCCLTPNTKINKIWLRCCQLKNEGINDLLPVLDETNEKSQLQLLYLDCNGITCEGAKKLSQVLRTNRTLQSLSLAKNIIKDEGAIALVNVLSKFYLNENEIKWKIMREKRRKMLVEYLMDSITLTLRNQGNIPLNNSNSTKIKDNGDVIKSIKEGNLKQKAEDMLLPFSHPYLTGLLFKCGLHICCPGNFKIQFLNISYNRFSPNVLNIIEQILKYQQKNCSAGDGITTLKIEGFETKQVENINKLLDGKRHNENKSAREY